MTEKRFKIGDDTECPVVEGKFELNREEVVDLLNKQDEYINLLREELELANKQNIKLKQENKELEKDLNDALNRIEERSIDVQLLKEENGNLKKENELKGDFRNFINEDIVRIKKENEKLKNEIKMLKSTIARNEAYITRLTKKGKWTK